ncbi:hypothetical protein D9615_008470 [Tricholomella constricta]|uniref:tRNA-dihydrouridine(16/17) synthase [NAD(P)(+)] n=1 Tax=Tricholomella constricta TaxID=117010 RepID=A0A8H5H3G6_9AGAR|nr:hypothetical protein D9615_008470 [Tricholomella constricta]
MIGLHTHDKRQGPPTSVIVSQSLTLSKMFADTTHKYYREQYFDSASAEEGAFSFPSSSDTDRPLIVQFCANSPEHLLAAAKLVEAHCDAVDINLGCPQEIARRGHYGAFIMDEWDLVFNLINTLHKNLSVPVTAKFRVFPEVERTVAYAQMLERAGAQILTCHGRTREQRGQNSGLASYAHIRAVKAAVRVPVFANGNILFSNDIARCLTETGADAVMSAEGVLYNPALFNGLPSSSPLPSSSQAIRAPTPPTSAPPTSQGKSPPPTSAAPLPLTQTNPPLAPLALEYLALVRAQRTRTSPSAVKGHLFKILRPALAQPAYWDLRERLGRVQVSAPRRLAGAGEVEGEGGVGEKEPQWEWVDEYVRICEEAKGRLEADAKHATQDGATPLEALITTDAATGLAVLPYWLAQPYFRPLKAPVEKTRGKKGAKKAEETMSRSAEQAHAKRPSSGEEEAEAKRMKLELNVGVAAGEAVAISVAA